MKEVVYAPTTFVLDGMGELDMMSYSSGESFGSSTSSIGGGEFEIARVLASLGNKTNGVAVDMVVEGGGGGEAVEGQSGNKKNSWGFKGKRSNSNSNKRIKETTSLSLHSSSPSPLPFDLNVDQPCLFQEDCEDVDVKMEDACESAENGHVSNPPHNPGRSRHNLTEAEKEARRVRRVLANRESARQTIRRRQAFHEELTRKAADLASENETLKRRKELAVKEFQSLQSANRNLKGQLSKTLGFKLGSESKAQAESSCTDNHHSSAHLQQLMYKKLSASPFVFPIRPSDLSVSQLTQRLYDPSCMLTEQENALMDVNGQKMPLCILPCPVFLPMPNMNNNNNNNNNNNDITQLSSLLLHDKDEGSSVNSRHLYSPSSVIHCTHNCHVVLPTDEKTGCQQSQTPLSFCLDGGGQNQQVVPHMSFCSRNERENCDCISPHTSPTSMNNTVSVLSENRKQRTARKKETTVAGAEARKKRKELMKLKNRLHFQLLGREDG